MARTHRLMPSYECYAEGDLPVGRGNRATLKVFRPVGGGAEVLALFHGEPGSDPVPLVRIQSACMTGEVFGSLKCDCGEQLRTALAAMAEATWAILLYLPTHEGRGIGLANKIRAYALQEGGLDTVAANQALGFPPDARDFAPAVAVLAMLGVDRVRLMTNNPLKIAALEQAGIAVVEQIPIAVGMTAFNREYLEAKRTLLGHLLPAPS